MITFITTFKPFKHPFDIIQLNALKSWLRFCPPCEIVVTGAEEGVEEAIGNLPHIKILPQLRRTASGAPLLDDLVKTGESVANHDLICLINGDIIIVDDILKLVKQVKKLFQNNFLLTCRRYDISINELINDNWCEKVKLLREQALIAYSKSKKRPKGTDLFVFGKGLFNKIPPFAVGRLVWSRWLIYKALAMGKPVIDATESLTVLHQQHSFEHIKEHIVRNALSKGKFGYDAIVLGQDYKRNLILGGVAAYFSEEDCDYILTKQSIYRRTDVKFLLRKLFTKPLLNSYSSRYAVTLIKVLMPTKNMRRAIKRALFNIRILY